MPLPLPRAAALAVLLPLLAACSEAQPQAAKAPPVVQTALVRLAPETEDRRYTGVVVARREAVEGFRVGGRMIARLVDVGDRVKAGQVLARLDPTDLDLAAESAAAEVDAAKAALARAAAEVARGAALAGRSFASASDLEGRELTRDEARGRLLRAERQHALARNQRAYAELTASADGVVTGVSAEAGQVVALGDPVLTLAADGVIEVSVAIPEGRLGDLDGGAATVSLWSDGTTYPARLRERAPAADAASRTYAVRFAFDDPQGRARLGMTATVALTRGDPRPVARLPLSAVLDQGAGAAVYVVGEGGRLALRPVTVLRWAAGEAVVSGLAEGERVVTLGVNRLAPDLPVRLASAAL
ncbi:efflux RND transporter periplasmic adaptor subunit [Prosthecomicrobium pneumaticum]|uniref:RND family efflux transporter MFP subunit n=1 Tax=Prosthecomicrobium pneumaticum TaxID=81895 RepID=A0A7W9FNW2_9HYPH|nr:efflux RND transporter periplasmic adaptor subunit [Prosthecomicrobium pneumaticum]MBB5754124.1 RND family efflux transporter MFP subunit [Prosthecomicrobium pneumaticum]